MRYRTAAMRAWGLCLLIAPCIFPALGRADSINTQVACFTAGQAGVSDGTSCSLTGAYGMAQDNLQVSVSYPTSPSSYFTIQVTDTGTAAAAGGNFGPDSGVESSASVNVTLDTVGQERAGYVEVSELPNLDSEYANSTLAFSIGDLQGNCQAPHLDGYCYLNTPGANYPTLPRLYDFTLGDPFSVQLAYTNFLDAIYEDGQADIGGSFSLQLRFFEDDQVTPVALSPEPETWGLITVALVSLAVYGARRRFAG